MRKREMEKEIKKMETSVSAVRYTISVLQEFVKIGNEQIQNLEKDVKKSVSAKNTHTEKKVKQPAVVSKKGGKPSKIEKPTKKTVKTVKKTTKKKTKEL